MRSHLILLVLVGLAHASNNPAWEIGTDYTYKVTGLSFTSLHEVSDWFSGIFLKAKLDIFPRNDGDLVAWISDAKYAQVHTQLPDGWNSDLPDSELNFKPLPMSRAPFKVGMSDGLITSIQVENGMPTWERDVIKGFLSQFQLDVKGTNIIPDPRNILPREDEFNGVFKTMEKTITGETETTYDIHCFPKYLVQLQPSLVPKLDLNSNNDIIEIVKSRNYTNSVNRPGCHYGFDGITKGHPEFNRMGTFFSREFNSHVMVTGNLSSFVIRSIDSINKIVINPTINAKEQGSVVSSFNITLINLSTKAEPPRLSPLVDIGSLVYSEENLLSSLDKDDSGSSEEPLPSRPKLEMCQPLARDNIYHNVYSIVQEIGSDLTLPENILTRGILSKYNTLSSLVRWLNETELDSISKKISSEPGEKNLKWVVFRDAVAEAGTVPSLSLIQRWIKSGKIKEREASEVIAAMFYASRFPTEDYMKKYFEMVQDPQVSGKKRVNETALLVFTHLINKVYVNRNYFEKTQDFYSSEGVDSFVTSQVIPFLGKKLNKAVTQADTKKIHVYIRALGNVGHRAVLKFFKPYLEGKIQVSQFQRMLIVLSMDKLVESEPKFARSILYNIYQNTAELPEIRVVAVGLLIKTNPPVEMLQRMAENTNKDLQEDVNAAVKTAIKRLSYLKSPESEQLRTAARSAKPLLTDKEYGTKHSFVFLHQFITENMKLELTQDYLHISSTDDIVFKGYTYESHGKMNGMKYLIGKIHAVVSSVKELTRVLYNQTEEQDSRSERLSRYPVPPSNDDNEWSSDKIAKRLELQTNEREQLEGFIQAQLETMYHLWSFDNNTIAQFLEDVRKEEEELKEGKKYLDARLRKLREMTLSLPTELGFPFVYTYERPLYVQFQREVKAVAKPEIFSSDGKLRMPDKILAEIDSYVTVSSKVQSLIKLITPFDNQMYIAGFDRNMHAYMPFKANANVDLKNNTAKIEIEVKENDKHVRLLHYSSNPFTSRTDLSNIDPIESHKNTVLIRSEKHRLFDWTFGRSVTGMNFRVYGHHPLQMKNILQIEALLKAGDTRTVWQQLWDEGSLQQTEASLVLTSDGTTTRKVTIVLSHEQDYVRNPQKEEAEPFRTMEQWIHHFKPDTEDRQQNMMKYVGAGIFSAGVHSLDASFKFEGSQTYKQIFTLTSGKSDANPLSRFVAFYRGEGEQTVHSVFDVKGVVPNTNSLDFAYAKSHEPNASYEAWLQHKPSEESAGEIAKIVTNIKLTRSEQRKQHLEKQPLYQVCKSQMEEGNRQLPACENMTIEANYFDDIKIKIKHENLNDKWLLLSDTIFKGIRLLYYHKTNSSIQQGGENNKVELAVRFEPEHLRMVNVTVKVKKQETKFINFTMSELSKALLVPHPVAHVRARLFSYVKGQENIRPTCVLDKDTANTFSNLTYDLSLDDKWTVMMLYIPPVARNTGEDSKPAFKILKEEDENFALLVRELPNQQKEVKFTVKLPESNGETVEFAMKPKGPGNMPSVSFNGQDAEFTVDQAADFLDNTVLVYALPNNEVKLEINGWFYITFNGNLVKVSATSGKLRESVVGLCGRFSQDKWEDFTIPDNCVVNSAEEFVQHYVDQLKNPRGKRYPIIPTYGECIPKELPLYTRVVPDMGDENSGRSVSLKLRTKYVMDSINNEICFTTNPVPVCDDRTVGYSVYREVPVHCLPMTKTAIYIQKQIDMGGNPDLSHKPVTKMMKMEIPKSCS